MSPSRGWALRTVTGLPKNDVSKKGPGGRRRRTMY